MGEEVERRFRSSCVFVSFVDANTRTVARGQTLLTLDPSPLPGSFPGYRTRDDDPEANIVAPVIRREVAAAVGGPRVGSR